MSTTVHSINNRIIMNNALNHSGSAPEWIGTTIVLILSLCILILIGLFIKQEFFD